MNEQQYLTLGVLSALLAVLSIPILATGSLLYFVRGAILSVAVPVFFGIIAVGAGIQLYRMEETRHGTGIIVVSLIAVAVGVLWGFSTVF